MKELAYLLTVLMLATTVAGSVAQADEPPASGAENPPPAENPPATVKPMFEEGKFKCTDGYDPDTDASLHPKDQNPKTRQLVNAQAQAAHEKYIQDHPKAPEPETAPAGEHSAVEGAEKAIEAKKEEEKKEGDKEKKEEKKGEKATDKKVAEEQKGPPKPPTPAPLPDPAKEANNPLNKALFAIQSKKYQACIDVLKPVIAKDSKNAQAHYLMAVGYVGLRNYPEAKEEYNTVLKLSSTNPKLSALADQGLKRISHSQ